MQILWENIYIGDFTEEWRIQILIYSWPQKCNLGYLIIIKVINISNITLMLNLNANIIYS